MFLEPMKLRILLCCLAICASVSLRGAENNSDTPKGPQARKAQPSIEVQLVALKKLLPELLAQFTEENPRVKDVRARIAKLEEAVATQEREKRKKEE